MVKRLINFVCYKNKKINTHATKKPYKQTPLGSNGDTMLTRRDFEVIASIIEMKESRTQKMIAYEVIRPLCMENPRFDEAKFLKACGI